MFLENKTFIIVAKGIAYNTGVSGRQTYDKGDLSISDLEELFLLEYPDFTKI